MPPLPGEVLATGTEPAGLPEVGMQEKDAAALAGAAEPEAAKGNKMPKRASGLTFTGLLILIASAIAITAGIVTLVALSKL